MMDQMTENDDKEQHPQESDAPVGIDDIISKVEGYVQDFKTVTPETMGELLTELKDLKDYLDTEESDRGEPTDNQDHGKSGLMITIGQRMKDKGGE